MNLICAIGLPKTNFDRVLSSVLYSCHYQDFRLNGISGYSKRFLHLTLFFPLKYFYKAFYDSFNAELFVSICSQDLAKLFSFLPIYSLLAITPLGNVAWHQTILLEF